jgi:hypothetical protein
MKLKIKSMRNQILYSTLLLLFSFQTFAQKTNTSENDDNSWPGFFKLIQTAVKSGDKNKIMSLCDFTIMTKAEFNEDFEFFFSGDGKKRFVKAKQNDAEKIKQDFEGLSNATEFYQITFNFIEKDEDGDEDESSLIYYFAKIKGKFRLIKLEMAG